MATKKSLTELAREFAREHPRRNPVDDDDEALEARVDQFIESRKRNLESLSSADRREGAWRSAFAVLGVHELDMPIYLDMVAAWGVDD